MESKSDLPLESFETFRVYFVAGGCRAEHVSGARIYCIVSDYNASVCRSCPCHSVEEKI